MQNYRRDYDLFSLECWGNGLAYVLTHKATGKHVCVQGDDALQFEQEREAAECAFPDRTDDQIMGMLWDLTYGNFAD